MCEFCDNLKYLTKQSLDPNEYLACAKYLDGLVGEHKLKLIPIVAYSCALSDVKNRLKRKQKDELLIHAFKCSSCGKMFNLYADTYHGGWSFQPSPLNELLKDVWIEKEVSFHGVKCKVSSRLGTSHYRLIAVDNEPEEVMRKDRSFTEYYEWGAVAFPVKCDCGETFWFDDRLIVDGDRYECECPNCGIVHTRKKMTW